MNNGWFHSGDLAVVHKNGIFKSKIDQKILLFLVEKIFPSVEIENTLTKHPAVSFVQ